MAGWLQYLIAGGALVVLAPLLGWLGLRHGRRIRGNLALASILLGFGHAIDPPPEQKVEAARPGKDARGSGEPLDDFS